MSVRCPPPARPTVALALWAALAAPTVMAPATAAPAPATPQEDKAPAPRADNWRVECANDGRSLDCRTVQQVNRVTEGKQQPVAIVTIRVPAETRKPVVLIQAPLGISVNDPVTLRVDENPEERFPIHTCTQAGCFAGGAVSEPLLAAMRGGRELNLGFRNINKQAVLITMPLTGFGLAYDKIK